MDTTLLEEDLKSFPKKKGIQIYYNQNGTYEGFPVFIEDKGKRIYAPDPATLIKDKNSIGKRAKVQPVAMRSENVIKAAAAPAPPAAQPAAPTAALISEPAASGPTSISELREQINEYTDVMIESEKRRVIENINRLELLNKLEKESIQRMDDRVEIARKAAVANPRNRSLAAKYEEALKKYKKQYSGRWWLYDSPLVKIRKERLQIEKKIKDFEKKMEERVAVLKRKKKYKMYKERAKSVGSAVYSGAKTAASGTGWALKGLYSGAKSGVGYLRNKTRKISTNSNKIEDPDIHAAPAAPAAAQESIKQTPVPSRKARVSNSVGTSVLKTGRSFWSGRPKLPETKNTTQKKGFFSRFSNAFKSNGATTTRRFRPGSVGAPATSISNSDPSVASSNNPSAVQPSAAAPANPDNADPGVRPTGGGYRATKRNRDLLKRWRRGTRIGFTATASLKAKGLIPRTSRKNLGKKVVSRKYK